MATHSSILAWETPWTEEPGGLQSKGCKESDMIEWATYLLTYNYSSLAYPNIEGYHLTSVGTERAWFQNEVDISHSAAGCHLWHL